MFLDSSLELLAPGSYVATMNVCKSQACYPEQSDCNSTHRWPSIIWVVAFCLLAVALRLALAYAAPTAFGYVYDFYHEPMLMFYESGELPDASDCWQCYHPPLYTFLGTGIYALGMACSNGDSQAALWGVAFSNVLVAFVFKLFAWLIICHYVKNLSRRMLMLALLLALPCLFISSFSIEADLLCSTFMIIAFYGYLRYDAVSSIISRSNTKPMAKPWLSIGLMGVGAGLAMGTKYSGLIILIVLCLLLGIAFLRQRTMARVVHGIIFIAISMIIGGWTYMDNYLSEGRPIVGNRAWRHLDGEDRRLFTEHYEFDTFHLGRLIDLMRPESPNRELKYFKVYNKSVLSSLYGQIWMDCSIFSDPSRHGLKKGLYPQKGVPVKLIAALLVVGLVPVVLSMIGLVIAIRRIPHVYPLLFLAFVTLALYTRWFLSYPEWMLKTKYLLSLTPVGLVLCAFGLAFMGRLHAKLEKAFSVILMLLIALANVYNLYFAIT